MIHKFGIVLKPLTLETAMLVRKWRNSKDVYQFMDFKDHINEKQQIEWFKKINNQRAYYFMIYQSEVPIGLIHLNRFNEARTTAYAGLFIGDIHFAGTGVTFPASINLLDFGFGQLSLKTIFAKVQENNLVAIEYNKALGFEYDGIETKGFIRLKLNEESFEEKKQKLLPLLLL